MCEVKTQQVAVPAGQQDKLISRFRKVFVYGSVCGRFPHRLASVKRSVSSLLRWPTAARLSSLARDLEWQGRLARRSGARAFLSARKLASAARNVAAEAARKSESYPIRSPSDRI